jgi:hypothetical protein
MMRALLSAAVVLTLVVAPVAVYAADQTIGEKLDDTAITTKIKAKLTKERPKDLIDVHVETKDGVVHLHGTVPNEADKADAERVARDTSGVKNVTNDLQVAGASTSTPSASPTTSSPSSTTSTPSASPSTPSTTAPSPSAAPSTDSSAPSSSTQPYTTPSTK